MPFKNTFFWLQYAIACANIGKYDLAQRFLEAAYSFFHDSEYTVPFQVDTQQARLYLLRIENEKTWMWQITLKKPSSVDETGSFSERQ